MEVLNGEPDLTTEEQPPDNDNNDNDKTTDNDSTNNKNETDVDNLDLLPTTTTSFDAFTPYQVLLLSKPPPGIAWYNFCRAHSIDMGQAHLLSREVDKNGVAILGTWPRDEAWDIERVLRDEIGVGRGEDPKKKGVRCIPAPMGGRGVIKVMPKEPKMEADDVQEGGGGDEPTKKKAKTASAAASSTKSKKEVNPEIQRLYDQGIITLAEFDQMQQADRMFEAEVATAPATFAVTRFSSSSLSSQRHQHLPPALKFDYNKGRRPDVYDAYAYRHNRRFWVNHRLYDANVQTLDSVCLVEFCRKFAVPKKGALEGKIKYHRKGVITKKLQFHPEYSSDPNFEDGRDYGKYCRFALVRYRPWVDAPFGRVDDGTAGEYKPEEDECIRRWAQYLLELRERMHLIPDVLLPEELKGGGASVDLLVVPDVERADEVDRMVDVASALEAGAVGGMEDEKKDDEADPADQTLDDVIRAAEEATLAKKAAEAEAKAKAEEEAAAFGATNADAAIVSDDDDEDGEASDSSSVLPSSFTEMGEADVETADDDDKEDEEGVEDEEAEDDDNPFASFVSNKMSGDDGDKAEEDTWLSSVMAAGAVAADAAERSAEDAEDDINANAASSSTIELRDDASFDSISKMFVDAKRRLSDVMSDGDSDAASDAASIAASDDSSQIEEVHNDIGPRQESDDCMALEETGLEVSSSFVKEELDAVDAEEAEAVKAAEAATAAILLQSMWRGHSSRKSVPLSAEAKATQSSESEPKIVIKTSEVVAAAVTPEKTESEPKIVTKMSEAVAAAVTPEKDESEPDTVTKTSEAVAAAVTPEKVESEPDTVIKTSKAGAVVTPEKAVSEPPSSPEEPKSAVATSTAPLAVRTRKILPPVLTSSKPDATASSLVSPRQRELEELRNMLKGRASESKNRLEAYVGQFADEQSRIKELRRMAEYDQNKFNELQQETTGSAVVIQSAWRRHKAQKMIVQHRSAARQHDDFVEGCDAMWKSQEATKQEESAATQGESAATQEESAATQEESVATQGEFAATQEESAATQEESSATQEESGATQEESSATQAESPATQEKSAATAIQSAARGYSCRRRYVALVQGCISLQAIARGSKVRVIAQTQAEDNNAAPAEHGDTNLTDEYCGSNASVGEYFAAAEDDDGTRFVRNNTSNGDSKKFFGRKKNQKIKGYSEMMVDSESDKEIDDIRPTATFFGRKSLATDGYYSEMLADDYASDSDIETTTSSPSRSIRNCSPKRRVKKMNDRDGSRRKYLVGSLLRKGKDNKKKKSVVAHIVDDEDTTGSILLSARKPTTKPRPKPKSKSKKSSAKKNKTRGVNKETGAEAPEFWQGFTVDMDESDIESDWEDDAGSFHSFIQQRSTPKVFDIRPIEEEEFAEGEFAEGFNDFDGSDEAEDDDPFAFPTPRAQCDFSKDVFPEDAVTAPPGEFSSYTSNRCVFPEEPLFFNPDNHWQKFGADEEPSSTAVNNEEEGAGDNAAIADDEAPIDKDGQLGGDEKGSADNDEESTFGPGHSIASAVTLKASASLCVEDDEAEEGVTSPARSAPATASTPDNGPGPLTQAALVDSSNIFPMENFRWEAAFGNGDETVAAADAPEPTKPAPQAEKFVLVPEASGEVEHKAADSHSSREVSTDDILIDLEGTLQQDEEKSIALSDASGRSRFKSLRRKKKQNKSSKPKKDGLRSSIAAAAPLMSTEDDGAMNFGCLDIPAEDDPSVSHVNISINQSIDEGVDGVEVSMDTASRKSSDSVELPVDASSVSVGKPVAPTTTTVANEEEMPIIAPSTITMTRFHIRPLGRTYEAADDVQL